MTDPDEHLKKLRALARQARGVGWAGGVFLLDELAAKLLELDQSLSEGGRLPAAWNRPVNRKASNG